MTACKGGIMGWIFGHKFIKSQGGWVYRSNYCYRCAQPKGDV